MSKMKLSQSLAKNTYVKPFRNDDFVVFANDFLINFTLMMHKHSTTILREDKRGLGHQHTREKLVG